MPTVIGHDAEVRFLTLGLWIREFKWKAIIFKPKRYHLENPYLIIIILSILIVISYVFNIVASRIRIPSVLLLLGTGIGLSYLSSNIGFVLPAQDVFLELLGIVGLIFIVLEGALDLHVTPQKVPLITRSLLAALFMLLATSAIICFIFMEFLDMQLKMALIYSVPLGVVSSSIAIPSVEKLSAEKKEFIVYESTFSDILGIMLFNYVILDNPLSTGSIASFFGGMLLIIVISAISSLLLLFLLNYARTKIKFFLIFAVLILVYSIAKIFHLPSLLLILIFGMMLNNANLIIKGKLANYLHVEKLGTVTTELKLITEESAFLIRTFFFILFGYTLNLALLADISVIFIGLLVIITIIVIRWAFLRFISKTNVFPEIFIAPRGLITIVLFYSIPAAYESPKFNVGILFFVIIMTALIMMFGLMRKGEEIPIITGNPKREGGWTEEE